MPPDENPTSPSGETEAPLSLREIAESAYDDIVDARDNPPEPVVDTGGRQRDEYGRFARAEPGEAEAEEPPSPDDQIDAPRNERPTQPPRGEAAGAPENWSQADKDVFAKAPPEIQAWAIRRHSEMEGDYQRKVQTYAAAAQFAQGVSPVFSDQRIAQSLQQWGITPQDAVKEWGQFHLQAIDPNPQVRAGFILDLAQRIGVPLNPAAFGQPNQQPSGLPPEVAKDPAIKFFADYLGQISTEVQAVKARTGQMEAASRQQLEQEATRVTKQGIDDFADMKDDKGNLLHPFFDEVIAGIQELYAANPRYNLREAYEKAIWSNPATREKMMQRQAQIAQRQLSDQRASQAARLNVRGRTSPVANGAIKHGPMSLRDTIEAAADELGM
jgi:hypothetical protein